MRAVGSVIDGMGTAITWDREQMSEMVEQVARAICESEGYSPDSMAGAKPRLGEPFPYVGKPMWMLFVPSARAAIAAMREPTQEMLTAMRQNIRCIDGNAGGESGPVPELEEGAERDGYQAAIDAAMREP